MASSIQATVPGSSSSKMVDAVLMDAIGQYSSTVRKGLSMVYVSHQCGGC